MKTVVPQGTGGSNPPCSVNSLYNHKGKLYGFMLLLAGNVGIRNEAFLLKFQGAALLTGRPVQDVPGSAEAGGEGANRMFATGTPNPPCSVNSLYNHKGKLYVIMQLLAYNVGIRNMLGKRTRNVERVPAIDAERHAPRETL